MMSRVERREAGSRPSVLRSGQMTPGGGRLSLRREWVLGFLGVVSGPYLQILALVLLGWGVQTWPPGATLGL